MLDIKYIRENAEQVCQSLAAKNRHINPDELLHLDQKQRSIKQLLEQQLQQKNVLSRQINSLRKANQPIAGCVLQIKNINRKLEAYQSELKKINNALQEIVKTLPNLPDSSVPRGENSSSNRIVRSWGEKSQPDFPLKPHWELGEKLDILDFEKGSQLAGTAFVTFKGWGARLERALINFMLDLHVTEHGYTEISPPLLARRENVFGTGQLPFLEADMYRLERDDLFLIPTAEVPLTNLYRNEILALDQLPLKLTAYTPCFRREAGAYGRENRGLVRIHQFDKVELVQIVEPNTSETAFTELLQHAETVLQLLELPYRVVELCTGELSFAAAKSYDLEVLAPGMGRYLEVSTCSAFTDFQARRTNIRYRPAPGKKLRFVHTLNASGVALPRTMIALLEHYQTDEGTIRVPEVLRKYLGTRRIT